MVRPQHQSQPMNFACGTIVIRAAKDRRGPPNGQRAAGAARRACRVPGAGREHAGHARVPNIDTSLYVTAHRWTAAMASWIA